MRQQPAGPPRHDQHHARAKREHSVFLKIANVFRNPDQYDRGKDNAHLASHPTQYDDRQNDGGFEKRKTLRTDKSLPGGKERSGESAEHGADRESGQFRVAGIYPERPAGDFVFPQCFPRAADRQCPDTPGKEIRRQRKNQNEVIQKDDPVDRRVFKTEKLMEGFRPFRRIALEFETKETWPRYTGNPVGALR